MADINKLLSRLRQAAESDIKYVVEELGKETANELRKNTIAAGQNPAGNFVNSITVSNLQRDSNRVYVEVYFDTDKLPMSVGYYDYYVERTEYRKLKDGTKKQRRRIRHVVMAYGINQSVKGEDIREKLIGWIEYGTGDKAGEMQQPNPYGYRTVPPSGGKVGIHHFVDRYPGRMIENTMAYAKQKYPREIARMFSYRGNG